MHCVQNISSHIYWVGGNDRRLELFENMFPLPGGVCYNSFMIMDEKTALVDTVDQSISRQFMENITEVLGGRNLDYLVINHMEPDHCANIEEIVRRYPSVKIVGNKKTFQMIEQFYNFDFEMNMLEVKEGDVLMLGEHSLKFFFAPMVHWPEVMFTYEMTEKILFSADAFGSFGALSGNIFSDESDFECTFAEEARRYYANIVGKFGQQVQTIMKKLSQWEIKMICPLHGPIWRNNIDYIIGKYDLWSRYEPEKKGVLLVYASMYGNTENVMNVIANSLAKKGVSHMHMYDVSKTHPSYIISDAWKFSHIVFGSPTYNLGLYYGMENVMKDMAALQFQNRKVALVGNGSWAPRAGKVMEEIVCSMKNVELICQPFEITSSMKGKQQQSLDEFTDRIIESMK